MKKILFTTLCLTSILAFASCASQVNTSGEITYKDGVYEAEGEPADNTFAEKVIITVSGGKITEVDYNSYNADGLDKKEGSNPNIGEYTYDMKKAGAKLDWYEQAELLEAHLIETQNPASIKLDGDGKTDSVAGVSITVDEFVTLSEEALKSAK